MQYLLMAESVQAESGNLAEEALLVLQAFAEDQTAASSTHVGLQRSLDVMKWYGDTWDCCANTEKTHIFLVGRTKSQTIGLLSKHWFRVSVTIILQKGEYSPRKAAQVI
jgi:hypothetical protein